MAFTIAHKIVRSREDAEEIAQDAVEVEVHKPRLLVQEKRLIHQHLFEWDQPLLQLRQQLLLLRAPLVEAAASILAFLVPQKRNLVRGWHELLPVNVVELEPDALDFVLDVAPQDGLHALQFPRKQP